ncbi:zf-HC2 domain-containing protein [Kitasatospora sp. NPDC059795]|uniref:zf-HC2 domain-containing protein n=1 Tax=Kitasatospora sp. NPDC059795 TaxID=3346949 RepID=UPI00364997AE
MSDHAPERADANGRSRWASLRRAEQTPAGSELRPVAVRPVEPAAEEHHHLGDRLTAFLDGELGHDARERVQAHLATCPECLAEAEGARAVKRTLSSAVMPGPSAALMARLMAVAALPEDDSDPEGPSGAVFGGSRLTGGSFGRGAGFGGGALGSDAPIPGIDPRAGLFGSRPSAVVRPLAALAELPTPRQAPARGRRLVFAAAGAFSVAAVTLGGLTAGQSGPNRPTNVTPVGGAIVPVNAQQQADIPDYPMRARLQSSPQPSPSGDPRQLLR